MKMRRRAFFCIDRFEDWLLDRTWWERVPDFMFSGQRLACVLLRHVPIPDHCGRPEHDICAYCSERIPFAAPRPS